MTVRDDMGDVKQTTTGFRGPLMVQSLTSAKSKFLSLRKILKRRVEMPDTKLSKDQIDEFKKAAESSIEEITDPDGEYDLFWVVNDGYIPDDITTKYGNEELTSENFIEDANSIFNKHPGLMILEGHQFPDTVGSIDMNGSYIDADEDVIEFFDKYFKDVALHRGANEDSYISIAIVKKEDNSMHVYTAKETSF